VDNPAVAYGAQGVLGTGFTSLSSIDMKVNQTGASWGRCLLYNIFAQNPSEPNFMAFALQRNEDPDKDVQGSFTIGVQFGINAGREDESDGHDKANMIRIMPPWPIRLPFPPFRKQVLRDGRFWLTRLSPTVRNCR
jgi:hypothetical protein